MNCPICNNEINSFGKDYYFCQPVNDIYGHFYKDDYRIQIASEKYQIWYIDNISDFYTIKIIEGLRKLNLSFSINSSFKIIKKSVDETYNHYYKLQIFS